MSIKYLFKEEKGAALPFVAIILGLFALGFIALVVDAGTLYVNRKAMVTAADAAALAGARVLEESLGNDEAGAREEAVKYAAANGADSDQIDVFVGEKTVTLPDGSQDFRKVVEVTAGKNQPLIFARFLNDDDADVKAHAVATWGYIYKTYIGEFIPIFTFDPDYGLETDIYLHSKIQDTNSYGFIDIGSGMGAIKEAIAGTNVGGTFIYDNYLDGKPGNGEAVYGAVVDRMKTAQTKATAQEREKAMIGLVPVIDKAKFMSLPENDSGNANQWKLPIKYFAYFEIRDVIKQGEADGSAEALNQFNEYKRKGNPPFSYNNIPPSLLNNKGTGAAEAIILGQFTGEKVEARTLAEAGDQTDPNPRGDTPATYSKLIK